MKKEIVFLFVLVLFSLSLVSAATYYVSPSGNDASAGGSTSPFKTIQKCSDTANAGDICLVQPGTYEEHVETRRGGTSDSNRITFRANGNVIMRGFNIKYPYITIDGFIIERYADTSVQTGFVYVGFAGNNNGSYCRIVNNTIRNAVYAKSNSFYFITSGGNRIYNPMWIL